jgi:hypothetical protein
MPNWVYNAMTITGPKEDLDSIESLFAKTIKTTEYNKETKKDEEVMEDVIFTYSAIISHSDMGVSDEEYYATNGFVDGKTVGKTSGNWYYWNVNHWGVKWDAVRPDRDRLDANTLRYSFESPWGPPRSDLWESLSESYGHRILIDYSYEEEQGWGGEWSMVNGEIISENEWELSHA